MTVEWIAVADRAPEEGTNVLVTNEYAGNRYVTAAYRHGAFWLGSESHEVLLGDVVAWTELPEPASI
ncbi:MAG: DUF551 domain-containing protein [Alphaproteobacteria bacterium]|nr:DUF551 domain-containing protein [Alphaproteobacteria bacterium]